MTGSTPMPSQLDFVRADPASPEIAALIEAHIVRSRRYYPVESCHTYGPDEMRAEGVLLFAALLAGTAVGIGGLKPLGSLDGPDICGEIKSMHTLKASRGQGIGARMLDHLLREARGLGWAALYLETGRDEASARARALYEARGFTPCPPFGDHVEDPLSVFMKRAL